MSPLPDPGAHPAAQPVPPPVPAADFVVFGGTGDLAVRKLLPALYLRDRDGQLTAETRIIALSRAGLDDAGYRDKIRGELSRFVSTGELDEVVVERFVARLSHVTIDIEHEAGWPELVAKLADVDRIRVFYLAIGPALFGPVSRRLAEHGLVTESSRLVLEKPIGHDLASAREINDAVGAVFEEHQIFRIDHYLGKESVQNLLVTRFANTFLEPLWNANCIDHVQITASESIGVGSRGGYYDESGRPARHGPEPPAAAALPGGDGASDLRRQGERPRREAQGAPGAATDRRRGRGPLRGRRAVRARPGRRSPGRVVPDRDGAARLGHRDLRGDPRRGAELALGRGPVLPAHRQADGAPVLGDRDPVQGRAAPDVPRRARAPASPTGWSSSCSPTRGCGCT